MFVRNIFFIFIGLFILSISLYSSPGDTTKIRAFEFQQRRIGWINFPKLDPNKVDRVLMNYKLRCPPGKPCGEWDYLAYVYVSKFYGVNFRVNTSFPMSFSYMRDTSWTYQYKDGNIIKTPKDGQVLYLYKNLDKPAIPSDSIIVWPTYYDNYTFDNNGKAIDSSFVEPDSTIQRKIIAEVDFNNDNTFKEDYEIFRYITPYGNGLSLGDGVNWVIDVSDFISLLSGKVFIHAPCGGWGDQYDQNTMEDLELSFDIIEGTPPRNPINMTKLWDLGNVAYDNKIEEKLIPYNYNFNSNEKNAVLRITQTGHGFGASADNCAEFCSKDGYVSINGTRRFTRNIWRKCGGNPIYPQGGTWIFNRSNWCPGAKVDFFDFDISEFIEHGKDNTIDYDMQAYNFVRTDDGTPPNWVIRGFLFTYGDANFKNDARLTKIISPSNDYINNRLNPTIAGPIIEIQNTGSNPITQVTIKYGNDTNNLAESTIDLVSPISIMEKSVLELPYKDWYHKGLSNIFYVVIVSVNGSDDEYLYNNRGQTKFESSFPEIPNQFIIEFTGNNSEVMDLTSSPYTYFITDVNSEYKFIKEKTFNNQIIRDTVNLDSGYYTLTIENPQGYGLGFWMYAQLYGLKNGLLKVYSNQYMIKQFPYDWGNFYSWSFVVAPQIQLLTDVANNKIAFGEVNINEKLVKEIKIFPANSKGIEISDIKLPLSSTKKFSIIEEKSTASPNPRILTQKDTITLKIEFEPLSKGNKNASLTIVSNDKYYSSKQIELTGIGIDPNSVNDSDIKDLFDINLTNIDNTNLKVAINNHTNQFLRNYTITNIAGQSLLKSNIDNRNEFTIDIQSLQNGVYFITFVSDIGAITKKFSVIK